MRVMRVGGVVAAGMLLAAACAGPGSGGVSAPPSTPAPTAATPSPTPSPSPTPPAAPTPPEAYRPSDDEVYPNAKQIASDIVQALLTYDPDVDWTAHVAAVAAGQVPADDLADAARPVYRPDAWSRARIVYPQLAGITPEAVSVMVVAEQQLGTVDGLETTVRTLDVRLRLRADAWAFDGIASAGGSPAPEPDELSPAARAVLAHPRIELPDSAVWDIHRGRVSDTLLAVMARAADEVDYGVVVLDTGHPWEIFGTDRQSDHSRGRAVDIYRVGDRNVVDDRADGSATHAFVRWLYEQPEVARIGSPWALDGFGGRSWTDALHQDHIHVAVAE